MSSDNKKKYIRYLGKVILIALLIVFLIRTFFIEPFTLSTSQMESSLSAGDRVVVNKTSYGLRLPQTILTIPFTFDSVFGFRSYSKWIEISYTRLFASPVSRNDVVLFNNPQDELKSMDKRNLLLSRSVGLPGDTIRMQDGVFYLGSNEYPLSPYRMDEYFVKNEYLNDVNRIMDNNMVSNPKIRLMNSSATIHLNRLEAYIVEKNRKDSALITKDLKSDENYILIVPKKGMQISITSESLQIYANTIDYEQGVKCIILNGQLFIDGQSQKTYVFEQDYYWLLSDNSANSIDSRKLGFIPFTHIIGKASLIWLKANNKDEGFFSFFSTIN